MVIFQYNLYIFGIRLWTMLYPKPCYNEPCYKEFVVYDENMLSTEEAARIVQFPCMSTFVFTH